MKALLALLAIASIAGTIGQWYPFASERLWAIGAVTLELWPWLLVLNAIGIALARGRRRVVLPVFALGAVLNVWPALLVLGVASDFGRQWRAQSLDPAAAPAIGLGEVLAGALGARRTAAIAPEKLPLGTLYYGPTAGAAPHPIVVDIHGGSWQHESAGTDGGFCSDLAAHGWAVFSLEYRLVPAARFPAQLDDVRAGIAWIRAHASEYGADASRLALVGRSAGGELALLAAYTSDAPIAAVAAYYAPADLAALYAAPPRPDPLDVRAKLAAFLGGAPSDAPEVYREASPSSHVRAGLPPTLLLQGTRDDVVPTKLTRAFRDRLAASGNRVLLLELPWSQHSFDFVPYGPAGTLARAAVVSFLTATQQTGLQSAVTPR